MCERAPSADWERLGERVGAKVCVDSVRSRLSDQTAVTGHRTRSFATFVRMSERAQKLEDLGFPLDRLPAPAASYRPLVIDSSVGYLSGAIPFDGGQALAFSGSVPSQQSVTDAQRAAALCAANLLRVLAHELGSLERIERILRVGGYVNSDPGFTQQHLVINGASELLVAVLGEAGRHARSAMGVAGLPLGASVEVDMIVRIKE